MSTTSPDAGRSLWLATAQPTAYNALDRDLEVDVAVIGGGIACLSAALALKRDGARVFGIDGEVLAGPASDPLPRRGAT